MDFSINIYLLQATHGLVYGMLIFLVASGFTLVYGMLGILNIAHVAFYMLGAYFSYTLTLYFGSFWLSLLICPVATGLIAIMIEHFLISKAHEQGPGGELIMTFGVFYVIIEMIYMFWGTDPFFVSVPTLFAGNIPFLGKTYPLYRLFIIGFSFLVLLGMALMLMRTRLGIIIRAAVSNAAMTEALGNNVPVVIRLVFGGGGALAGLAGVIAAPLLSTYPEMGIDMLMDCFVVVVIGGFGSLFGVFLASFMIGELHSFGIFWIPQLAMIFPFLLMFLVLTVRPTGLLGENE